MIPVYAQAGAPPLSFILGRLWEVDKRGAMMALEGDAKRFTARLPPTLRLAVVRGLGSGVVQRRRQWLDLEGAYLLAHLGWCPTFAPPAPPGGSGGRQKGRRRAGRDRDEGGAR